MGGGYPFGKLCRSDTLVIDDSASKSVKRGVAVDIFPLFECSEDHIDKLVYFTKMIDRMFRYEHGQINSKLKNSVLGLFTLARKNNQYYCDKFLRYAEGLKGDKFFAPSPYLKRDIHDISCFDSDIMNFEGHELCVPRGFDKILTEIYGDYMTPPPQEKRISHHKEKAYWINDRKY